MEVLISFGYWMYMGEEMSEETEVDPSIQYVLIGKMREGWINSERWVFALDMFNLKWLQDIQIESSNQ